jgi:N-acetylmuramoyl-L-alanine amidase
MDWRLADIRKTHIERGFRDVGYHFVIGRDGKLERGRSMRHPGAHIRGFNQRSIGICMVGGVTEKNHKVAENNFTPAQFRTLRRLLWRLHSLWPEADIQGHRDFPRVTKACPSFDVEAWLRAGLPDDGSKF